jgi:hypothetical protein
VGRKPKKTKRISGNLVEINLTLQQAMKAQRERRGIALLHF